MDDLELDRKLQAALGVAPSPDFVARVRMKIAEAPPPSVFAEWLRPATIACIVIAAISMGWLGHSRRTAESGPSAASIAPGTAGLKPSTANTPSTASVPTVVVPIFPPPRVQRSSGRGIALAKVGRSAKPALVPTSSAAVVEPPLPDVIIAPGDVEALRQFVTSAREVRFVASFDETPAPIPWVVTELSIAPIMIEPLGAATVNN